MIYYVDKGYTVWCRNWYSETDSFIGTFDSYGEALKCLEKERQRVKQEGFKVVNDSENRFEVERKNFTAFGTDKYYIRTIKKLIQNGNTSKQFNKRQRESQLSQRPNNKITRKG